jgi:hypothetical protein
VDEKKWHEERSQTDAPVWMSAEMAAGWASGWNAAVERCVAELDEALKKELRR